MAWHVGLGISQGDHHKKNLQPCQDFARYLLLKESEIAVVCLADGAGTASQGGAGASLAIEETIRFLPPRLLDIQDDSTIPNLYIELLGSLHEKIEKAAFAYKVPLKEMATTLLVAVFTPRSMFSFQIGDGFIVVNDAQKGLQLWSDHIFREYINETNFLTDIGTAPKIKAYYGRCSFWAMATDGLEPVAIDQRDKTPFEGFFHPFQEYLASKPSEKDLNEEVRKFVHSKKLHDRVKDDITLAVGGWWQA